MYIYFYIYTSNTSYDARPPPSQLQKKLSVCSLSDL